MTMSQFSHDNLLGQKLPPIQRQPWRVGALCLAISDSLQARFNPVVVRGEVSSFARAASGHCYFTLKDSEGQMRVALFRRAAIALNFNPRDGEQVEVTGRLGVYEQRGELQLIAETMSRVGQGTLLETFMRLKEKLQSEGLFDVDRKRPLSQYPRGIGVVTSLDSAAWHDVVTTLERRVPHIPVLLSPSIVQGVDAPTQLVAALQNLYTMIDEGKIFVDVILLVRGGGTLEDLWAFNDERLAYTIAQSPVPIISGVGHEIDFSISDFVADVRAPTPTAAAELCAEPALQALSRLALHANVLQSATRHHLERCGQILDTLTLRLARPAEQISLHKSKLKSFAGQMQRGLQANLESQKNRLSQCNTRLGLLHPQHVLDRGFAWVSDEARRVVTDANNLKPHQTLELHFAKGQRNVVVV